MRLFSIILFLLFSEAIKAQTALENLKNDDNLSEFIYVQLDDFAKNPQVSNLELFSEIENQLWRLPKSTEEHLAVLFLKINKAYYYKKYGLLNEATTFYESAYLYFKQHSFSNYDIIEYCLKPLLNTYTRLGAFERAEIIGVRILELANTNEKYSKHITSGYLNLAVIKRTTGSYLKAITYLNKALLYAISNTQKARIYSDLAINYLFLSDNKNVLKMVELSKEFNVVNDNSIHFRNLKTLGLLSAQNKKFKASIGFFKEALTEARIIYGRSNREVAKILNLIGQSYFQNGNNEKALQYYQESLVSIIPNFEPKKLYENPKIEQLYAENSLIEALEGKAKAYDKSKLSMECYDLAFEVEKLLRNTFLSQESKLLIQQESRSRSEICIEICDKLFQKTQDKQWLERAFLYAEKSKAIVLAETKRAYEQSLKFKNDTLFQKRTKLQLYASHINTKILNEQFKRELANVNLLASLNKEKDSLFNDLALLNSQIESKYSEKLVEVSTPAIANITGRIQKNQLIVEFFVGENNIYIFKISSDNGVTLTKFSKKRIIDAIETYISFFTSERGTKFQNEIGLFNETSHFLFKSLINERKYKQLFIIPDGVLNLLSFEALLTEPSNSNTFSKLPYLVKTAEVNYAFSTSLLFSKQKQLNLKTMLGFFPVFENNYRGLASLEYTKKEAENIQNHFKGSFYTGNQALKSTFEKHAANADIIHLSTHAFGGDFYLPPSIEFYDKKMQLPEIYGYHLEAELIVLSACETGVGMLRKGEGAMSLARGFSYAGIDNLIVSLWQVNDKSTQQLMTSFYKNLKRSKHIATSIRSSKLEYLNDDSISVMKKSPYYWAGFIFIGEYSKIDNKTNYFGYLAVVVLLITLLYLIIKKR